LGVGRVLDPFAGSGSTLAAANAVGYRSVGVEMDPAYFTVAKGQSASWRRIKTEHLQSGRHRATCQLLGPNGRGG